MPYLEGAVVCIDNASGGVRALVGGRDYSQSKFNRALAPANRQLLLGPHYLRFLVARYSYNIKKNKVLTAFKVTLPCGFSYLRAIPG